MPFWYIFLCLWIDFGILFIYLFLRDSTVEHKNGHSSSHRASQKLSRRSFDSKLRRASFEGIGMQFYEILQWSTKSTKIDENRRKVNENQRKSTKIDENLRKSTKISENRRKSTKIYENLRKSTKIYENLWRSIKIHIKQKQDPLNKSKILYSKTCLINNYLPL